MNTVLHETCEQYIVRRLSEGWRVAGRYKHLVFLSPPDGSFLRPVDLRNDIETLRPNAAGSETSIDNQEPEAGSHYDKVNEEEADEDTYVHTSNETYQRDLYNLPAHSIGSGTITFITVYFRGRKTSAGYDCYGRVSIRSDSVVTDDSEDYLLSTFWTNLHRIWTTNPADGQPWEWTDIDALQIGVCLKGDTGRSAQCTQVYVEIDYSPVTTAYKDIATRFRLQVQAFTDIVTRFKLWTQGYQDIAARFKLTVQNYQDIATRFRLIVQGLKDTTTRFKLQSVSHQDVSTRFYLYLPSWKSLEILKDIEALEAKVAGLKREPKAHFEI